MCLVTGGTSGIGKATATLFGLEGARVSVVGHDEEDGRHALDDLRSQGIEAIYANADVADEHEAQAAIVRTLDEWGRIDVLVNNAAMMTFAPVVDLPTADWDRVLAVNLRGAFLFSKFAVPRMSPGSSIVNVSSVHAHETTVGVAPYAASKAGLEALTRALSRELVDHGIRVNSIAPGSVDTPMLWENPNVKSGKEKVEGAIGKPEDIAAAILFLASDEARFINGTTLVADGGRLDIL